MLIVLGSIVRMLGGPIRPLSGHENLSLSGDKFMILGRNSYEVHANFEIHFHSF